MGGVKRRKPAQGPRAWKVRSICQVCEWNRVSRGRLRGCPDAKVRKRKCERFTPTWDDEVT